MSERGIFDLTGRVAIITGATSGLGWRFAEVLQGAGASVVLAGRRADRLEKLQRDLDRSLAVPCDIADAGQRADLVAAAVDTFGSVDVLVNNAGVSGPAVPAQDLPRERWESTVGVNLSGLFDLTQVAGRRMLEQGRGSVINIGSVFGLVGNAPVMDAAYAATKGALVNLTRELALEWEPHAADGPRAGARRGAAVLRERRVELLHGTDAGHRRRLDRAMMDATRLVAG